MESVCVFCTPILCDFRQFNWSAMLASVILFRCCSVLSWRHFLSGSTADQDQYQGTASQILGWICSVMYPLFIKVQNYSVLVQENTWKKHAHTCTNPWNKIALLNFFLKFFWAASVLGQCLGRQCFGGPSFSCEMIIWRKKRHGENKRVLWEYEYLRLLFRGKNSFNFSIKNTSPYFQVQCIASCLNAFFVEMRPF